MITSDKRKGMIKIILVFLMVIFFLGLVLVLTPISKITL